MAVYVDPLLACVPNPRWRWNRSCHLVADGLEELHAFAVRIGLRRAWFQDHGTLPHYDLTEGRRERAVRLGAIEITREEMGQRIRAAREEKRAGPGQARPAAVRAMTVIEQRACRCIAPVAIRYPTGTADGRFARAMEIAANARVPQIGSAQAIQLWDHVRRYRGQIFDGEVLAAAERVGRE